MEGNSSWEGFTTIEDKMKIKLEIEIDPKEVYDIPKYINIPKLIRELNRIINKLRELK